MTPPQAQAPVEPDGAAVRARFESDALAGIGWFKRAARAQARAQAVAAAEVETARQRDCARAERAAAQQALDAGWRALVSNDPGTVLATLAEAFADNEMPSAAIDVTGDEASVTVLIPSLAEAVPEQIPDTTKSGNPTLRRLGKRERNDFYVLVACGHVLATVRETLAVAPGIQSVRAVALRAEGQSAYGAPRLGCVLATRFTRRGLQHVAWESSNAATIVTQIATEHLLRRGGPAHDVLDLDLTDEPDLQALLRAVTSDDDTHDDPPARDHVPARAEGRRSAPRPRAAPPSNITTDTPSAAPSMTGTPKEPHRASLSSRPLGAGHALRVALETTGRGRDQLRNLPSTSTDPDTLRAPMQQIAQRAIDSSVAAMEETTNLVVEALSASGESATANRVGETQLRCGMDMLRTAMGTGKGLDATEVCDGVLAGLRVLELAQRSAATGQPVHPAEGATTPATLGRARAAVAAGRRDLTRLTGSAAAGTLNAQATVEASDALTEISSAVVQVARGTGAHEQTGRAALPYIRHALSLIKIANESMGERGAAAYFDQVETFLDLLQLAHNEVAG